jgi:DMSO reductase anchor subunit
VKYQNHTLVVGLVFVYWIVHIYSLKHIKQLKKQQLYSAGAGVAG